MIEFTQQTISKIDLNIPIDLINENSSNIKYDLIDNKIIIGLCGYSRSGKDILADLISQRLGFKKISFGEILKRELNEYMKNQVYDDIKNNGINISLADVDFLNYRNKETKEILRPYMIWYGEKMKKINGVNNWVNKAIECIGESKKVVITDVRRVHELDLFLYNRNYYSTIKKNRADVQSPKTPIDDVVYDKNYESLLININQRDLIDKDDLTTKTITTANEKWLFDYVVYVDSKIPESDDGFYREKHMLNHLYDLVKKFPEYFV